MDKLLQALLDDPDDPHTALVYADWLQSQGDPRGELISTQVALETAREPQRQALLQREQELLRAHDFLPGVDEQHATVRWRRGFFDGVRFDNSEDWMDADFEIWPTVRAIFAQPAARLLRELRVGVIRWEYQEEDAPRLLELVAELGFAGQLRKLVLGDVDKDIDLAHHALGDLVALGPAYCGLRELHVWGWAFRLGPLPLPELRLLKIETCGLSRADLLSVIEAPRPELEELVLWFGSANYGSECVADDLEPLLAHPERFPRLRRLGLMNAEFTNALCPLLARSPLLRQLEALDLSLGTLDDQGARPLLESAEAFVGLQSLSLEENFLDRTRAALQARYGERVRLGEQKKVAPSAPDWRYVSVGE